MNKLILVLYLIMCVSCNFLKSERIQKSIKKVDYTHQALEIAFDTLYRYNNDTLYVFDKLFIEPNIRTNTYGQANTKYYYSYVDTTATTSLRCTTCKGYLFEIQKNLNKQIVIQASDFNPTLNVKLVSYKNMSYVFSPLLYIENSDIYYLWSTFHSGDSDYDLDYVFIFEVKNNSLQLATMVRHDMRGFYIDNDYLKDAKF